MRDVAGHSTPALGVGISLQGGAQFTGCVKSSLAIGLLHVARDTGSAGRNAG